MGVGGGGLFIHNYWYMLRHVFKIMEMSLMDSAVEFFVSKLKLNLFVIKNIVTHFGHI